MSNAARQTDANEADDNDVNAQIDRLMVQMGLKPSPEPTLALPSPDASDVEAAMSAINETLTSEPANQPDALPEVLFIDLENTSTPTPTSTSATAESEPHTGTEELAAQIAAANGVVPADDPAVKRLVLMFEAVAGDDRHNSPIFLGDPPPEAMHGWLNSLQLAINESNLAKVRMARDIAKHQLEHGKKKRSPRTATNRNTNASQAGTRAPRTPSQKKTAKAPKEVTYVPFSGGRVTLAHLTSLNLLAPRTYLVRLPEELLIEEAGTTRGSRNRHQFDLSRTEGYAPVMPCLDRLANTGNPYPLDENDPVVQPHGEQYRPFVKISHAVWEALRPGVVISMDDEESIKGIVVGAGQPYDNDTVACVRDTLRDLWSCGLATQETAGGRKRRFSRKV